MKRQIEDIFYGNKNAVDTLKNLLGRLPHGILITGEKGVGKRTFARLIAAAVICESENAPCLECNTCRRVFKGIHPDVLLYEGENGKSFKIDTVREIKRTAFVKPNEAPRKVYILANCESMTVQAQNSLLKLLEEPPENVVLILTALQTESLLETVLSRVAVIPLHPLDSDECAERLKAVAPSATDSEREHAAKICGGNLGKAADFLTDPEAAKTYQIALSMVAGADKSEYELLLAAKSLCESKALFVPVMRRLREIYRDILALRLGSSELISGDDVSSFCKGKTRLVLTEIIEFLETAEELFAGNINYNLLVSLVCTKLYG